MSQYVSTIEQPTPRAPYYTRDASHDSDQCTSITLLLAIRIGRKYSRRVPTVPELMDEYGMSRATAYRWISAIRNA